MDAVKLRDDLKPLISKDADVAANEASNTIVITDTCSNIRRMARVIFRDGPGGGHDHRHADRPAALAKAADAVKLIDTIFKGEPAGAMPGSERAAADGDGPERPAAATGRQAGGAHAPRATSSPSPTIAPTRSSSPARPRALKTIEGILEKLDSNPIPTSQMKAYPLQLRRRRGHQQVDLRDLPPRTTTTARSASSSSAAPVGGDQAESEGDGTFDERTNTVIVTAPADALKQVDGLVGQLDANPIAAAESASSRCKYADAYSAEKLITSIFNPTKSTKTTRVPDRSSYGHGPTKQAKGAKVTATSDDRTNTLVVTAPTESMRIIEGIVRRSTRTPPRKRRCSIYHLRNAQAANLELVLNMLFGNIQGGGGRTSRTRRSRIRAPDGNNNNRPEQSGTTTAVGPGATATTTARQRQPERGNNRRRTAANMPPEPAGPAAGVHELSGQVFVVADRDTNSLLVTTASKYQEPGPARSSTSWTAPSRRC